MIRKLLLLVAGLLLAVLGVIGLLLPVLPGVLLLAAAAVCLSLASKRLRHRIEGRLDRDPRYRRAVRRWQAGAHLPWWRRAQLACLLAMSSVMPGSRS